MRRVRDFTGMTKIYTARWVLPIASPPIEDGAVAVEGKLIVGVGSRAQVEAKFPDASFDHLGSAVILPGLINSHTHLELTAMRGYLETEESDFFSWLKKLTVARLERMSADDIHVSAMWGACEAVRAGVTAVGDASDSALISMRVLQEIGLRGIVFQESFGPDPKLVDENFARLREKVQELILTQSELVQAGVSPHAPYTVCAPQLELIADFAVGEQLPLMIHAAESRAEDELLLEGKGLFAEGLLRRSIEWTTPGVSTIEYLRLTGILATRPLLAHCIRVDENDICTLFESKSKIAHCPKSNAKLGHGHAPLTKFRDRDIAVGLGSDSVASNNICDLIEESRFAVLLSRSLESTNERRVTAEDVLMMATRGGAQCLGLEGKVGEISEGAFADFTVIAMDGVHQSPLYDPIASVVFASSGRDVTLTVIGGKEIYRNGEVVGIDQERLSARMKEIEGKLKG
jgi:cytosine/adenosine deaminase-related metal-dependent hydrolase